MRILGTSMQAYRISTTGAYRALMSKADIGICICPFCPAIRRGMSQLWSSFPLEWRGSSVLPRHADSARASCRLPDIGLRGSLGRGNKDLPIRSSVKETHRLYEQLRRLVVLISRLEGCDISHSVDPRQMGQPSNLELAPNAPPSI